MTAPRLNDLVRRTHRFDDSLLPQIPWFDFPELKCEDHATYVTSERDEDKFRGYWRARGLHAVDPLVTTEFPARHIALLADPGEFATCEDMVGLSVSYDPQSPINRLVMLYGGRRIDEDGEIAPGRLQHIAYAVDPDIDVHGLRRRMEEQGVTFMTPVLEFDDANGATLTQIFVACVVPYGPFVEIVQRRPGRNGEPFGFSAEQPGFNPEQIDILYGHYDTYSKELSR